MLCRACGFEQGGTLCACSPLPARREIPAGKVLLAEYGELTLENRARCRQLAEAPGMALHGRPMVSLWWSSPGFESAGAVARWTNGFLAVWWDQNGARQGRRYADTDEGEAKARAHFARLTVADAGVPA